MKLLAFDMPHRRIHGIAEKALELSRAGKKDEALSIIDTTRKTDLLAVENLFDNLIPLLMESSREVLLIYKNGNKNLGLIVDAANEVRRIDPQNIQAVDCSGGCGGEHNHLLGTAQIGDGKLAMLLNIDYLTSIGDTA